MRHLGYRHLLGGVFLLYLLIIVVPSQDVGAPLRVAVLSVLLLMAIRTGRRAGGLATPSVVLVVVAVVATLIAAIAGNTTVLICISQAATVVLVLATIIVLARTLLAAGVIDKAAVGGVLTIYLLLGLLFSALHGFAAALITDYLTDVGGHASPSDTLYFSLITLTTVGYGDITPAANLARAIAAGEALTGQLYLVSVVAVVVSRYQPTRPIRTATTDAPESPKSNASASDAPLSDAPESKSRHDENGGEAAT